MCDNERGIHTCANFWLRIGCSTSKSAAETSLRPASRQLRAAARRVWLQGGRRLCQHSSKRPPSSSCRRKQRLAEPYRLVRWRASKYSSDCQADGYAQACLHASHACSEEDDADTVMVVDWQCGGVSMRPKVFLKQQHHHRQCT